MADRDADTSWMTYLSVDTGNLAEWVVNRGSSGCGHRSDKRTFISVGCLVCTGTSPANIHDVETWLHTAGREVTWESYVGRSKWHNISEKLGQKGTHWLLWGKSSRCCIVTKGWLRASAGEILSSASIISIFFSRPTNSLRSALSASKSLPSRFITKFTWNTNILLLKLLVKLTFPSLFLL